MRLTDLMLTKLPAPEKGAKVYADDTLEGFGVRVSQGGTRAFVLTYGADRRRITIGRVGIISLADARGEAKRILAERTLGKHLPGRVRAQDALQAFLEAQKAKNRPRTVQETTWLLESHFKPLWTRQLADITNDDVLRITDRLVKQGKPSAANHAMTAIKTFFRWCVKQRKYIPHSPLEGVDLPAKVNARERVLTDDELRELWKALQSTPEPFSSIVKLLLLTGQRRNQIASLRREWITENTICFPKEIMKGKREHKIPLSSLATSILGTGSTSLIFPSRMICSRESTFHGWSKAKAALDKKLTFDFHLHDLRRTYATTLQRLNVKAEVIDALLSHVQGGVRGIYQRHPWWNEMVEAVNNYDRHISQVLQLQQPSSTITT